MKAIRYETYGPPETLQLKEADVPAPGNRQVLVKVHAASINAMDWRRFAMPSIMTRLFTGGWFKPKDALIGTDVAGRVEAIGEHVTRFKPGDEVFGFAHGSFAEYALSRESNLTLKPANRSFEEAAATPVAALTALQGLRDAGKIQRGQKVLIHGASGGVGSFAIQIAKYYGGEVAAVCSTKSLEMARSIGADHVIDYTREDFARKVERYDLIFAVNGYRSLFAYKRALRPQGIYVCAGGALLQFIQAMVFGPLMSTQGGRQMRSMGIAKVNQEDLVFLAELLGACALHPVIDRRYPLSDIVEAIRYMEGIHPQGKVVVQIA